MYQRASFRLNRLDWGLLIIIVGFATWLLTKDSGTLAYHWQWSKAIQLLFTPKADGSLPYFLMVCFQHYV